MCTVHSFPQNIDHCLTWAQSEFEGLLEKTPTKANTFLSNPTKYASSMTNVKFRQHSSTSSDNFHSTNDLKVACFDFLTSFPVTTMHAPLLALSSSSFKPSSSQL
ncbi:hypothetical protein VitviT2T_030704 [Vitis vinifera]|uniref:Ubiquitin-activating enzyme SCCH domain-containing protein n=2 Tax=Vitis vinifera TaxID=29760 RepID=A0ABY9E0X9_VITVI|nr:hypothetical protein VitviT2T_030704 [Vitis vinifera]